MNKMKHYCLLIFLFISGFQSFSQDDIPQNKRDEAVKVFIDCERCDMDHNRRKIPYVNYVRDVREAQLYIRETRQTTGSGGRE